MIKVTIWKRAGNSEWVVDHVEDGWVEGDKPLHNPENIKFWRKEFAFKDERGNVLPGYTSKKVYYE